MGAASPPAPSQMALQDMPDIQAELPCLCPPANTPRARKHVLSVHGPRPDSGSSLGEYPAVERSAPGEATLATAPPRESREIPPRPRAGTVQRPRMSSHGSMCNHGGEQRGGGESAVEYLT